MAIIVPQGTPNTINPPSIAWKIETAALATIIPAFLFVIARIYTKIYLTHSFGWEDHLAIAALVIAIGRTAVEFLGTRIYGIGLHFNDVPFSHLNGLLTVAAVDGYLYMIVTMLAKMSLLLFIYRNFKVSTKFRYTAWVVGTVIVLWTAVSVALAIFSCRPLTASWNLKERMDPSTVCRPEPYMVELVYGYCNIIADFALLIMPLPLLYNLKMPTGKKIATSIVFATGSLVVALAIRRQYIFYTQSQAQDPSWQIVTTIVWMILETNIAIICCCLPVLLPLVRRLPLLAKMLPSSIRSKLSGPGGMERAPWPAVLNGPRSVRDVERGEARKHVWGKGWREPEDMSERSGSEERMGAGVGWHSVDGLGKFEVQTMPRALMPVITPVRSRDGNV